MILSHIYRYTLTFWLRQFDRVSIILPSIFQSKFPLIFLIKSINQSFLFVVVMSAKKVTLLKKGCVILVWVKQVVTSRVRRTFVVFRQLEFSVNYATARPATRPFEHFPHIFVINITFLHSHVFLGWWIWQCRRRFSRLRKLFSTLFRRKWFWRR